MKVSFGKNVSLYIKTRDTDNFNFQYVNFDTRNTYIKQGDIFRESPGASLDTYNLNTLDLMSQSEGPTIELIDRDKNKDKHIVENRLKIKFPDNEIFKQVVNAISKAITENSDETVKIETDKDIKIEPFSEL